MTVDEVDFEAPAGTDENGHDLRTKITVATKAAVARVLAGHLASFLTLLLLTSVVLAALFATVHDQKPAAVAKTAARYEKLIMFWHDRGYFRHGGLWVWSGPHDWTPPKAGQPVHWIYRTSSMGYLQLGNILERIHLAITGKYSIGLMSLHNQALIWLSSALLGWLAMRLVMRVGVIGFHALLLGVGAAVVFQTFPPNLAYFWETYYSAAASIFAAGFLLTTEPFLMNSARPRRMAVLRAISVFGMFYTDPPTALFFMAMYVLVALALGYPVFRGQRFTSTVLVPIAIAYGLFAAQIAWVTLTIPGIAWTGSLSSKAGILFRTGLDGSVEYVHGPGDLFTFNRINSGLKWPGLLIAGVGSLGFLMSVRHRLEELKYPTFILAAAIGLWIPFAFVFSQGVSIHPHAYDTYLVIPLVLSLFAVLPATLERLTGNRGTYVLGFFVAAICYSMVSLRAYATDYPVVEPVTSREARQSAGVSAGGDGLTLAKSGNATLGGTIKDSAGTTPTGEWMAFTPSYGAQSGTFTAKALTARYTLIGKTLVLNVYLVTATITDTPKYVTMMIPGGFTAASTAIFPIDVNDNGTAKHGSVQVSAGSSVLQIFTGPGASGKWAKSAGTSGVYLCLPPIEIK